MKTKKCSNPKCKNTIKPISKFDKNKSRKDGLQGYCKECRKEYRLENKSKIQKQLKGYYLKHKTVRKEKSKKYYKENKVKILEKMRKYQLKNKDTIRKRSNIWYQKNKEELKRKRKIYYKRNKGKTKIQLKKYALENKEKISLNRKESYLKNKDKIKEYQKKNKERIYIRQREYILNNREKINESLRKKRQNNTNFRLASNLRRRLHQALKRNTKYSSAMFLLGCEIDYLMYHLQNQFTKGMSWDNYGDWHIDHIKPCVKFDLSKPEEQRGCFHYTNLQPLWAIDNYKKGSKIT